MFRCRAEMGMAIVLCADGSRDSGCGMTIPLLDGLVPDTEYLSLSVTVLRLVLSYVVERAGWNGATES